MPPPTGPRGETKILLDASMTVNEGAVKGVASKIS